MDQQPYQHQPQPSQQPMSQEPGFDELPKPKNTRLYFLVAIVVLIGAVAYGGIWWWGNQSTKVVVPTFTPRPDPTADWQTYRNERYRFEIRFTEEWKGYKVVTKPSILYGVGEHIYFKIPTPDPEYKDVDGEKGYVSPLILEVYPKSVLNKVSGGDIERLQLARQNKSHIFVFTTWQDVAPEVPRLDLEKIISTFKFIDTNLDSEKPVIITPKSSETACDAVFNLTFKSIKQHEVGLGPDGEVMGYWNITFKDNSITWHHSDVVETGIYSCSGAGTISVKLTSSRQSFNAFYNLQTNRLTWQAEEYAKFTNSEEEVCIQLITPARNPETGEVGDFPTPCDVPEGWEKL